MILYPPTHPQHLTQTRRPLRIQKHVLSLDAFLNRVITEEAFLAEQEEWERLRLWDTP